jgi:hypothetical protein
MLVIVQHTLWTLPLRSLRGRSQRSEGPAGTQSLSSFQRGRQAVQPLGDIPSRRADLRDEPSGRRCQPPLRR